MGLWSYIRLRPAFLQKDLLTIDPCLLRRSCLCRFITLSEHALGSSERFSVFKPNGTTELPPNCFSRTESACRVTSDATYNVGKFSLGVPSPLSDVSKQGTFSAVRADSLFSVREECKRFLGSENGNGSLTASAPEILKIHLHGFLKIRYGGIYMGFSRLATAASLVPEVA